ncbi:glutamate--tRNA ligase, partial [Candidatus Falkowbacteria bacterium]|nr:glutamate--tRNA ligase [Candidatus Falkowbacteria bacterium]
MSEKQIRVRFAPSPTGYLHIGNLRNAFFDYLIAKKYNGKLILRIEDTDQKRAVEDAVPRLLDIMQWCGIEFDEGAGIGGDFGPYIQTERLDIYKKYAEQLLEEGKAYYCFCTPERLEEMRNEQQAAKQAPRYDRCCKKVSLEEAKKRIEAGEKAVIRQAMPEDGEVVVHDELRGDLKFDAKELDDHVLIKSNGIPTYQFASVVDDHFMEITHVLRSEEWIASLPKNILLYQVLGWTPPKFIHPSLILNKTGGKLSKRQGDVAVEDFRAKGYLPEAILNFMALLGWNPYSSGAEHGESVSEFMTIDEIIDKFKMEDITTSPAVFDTEKLDFLNG